MSQNVSLWGANYSDVPSLTVPKTGGGIATFADPSGTTAVAADVAQGKYFLDSSGILTQGTASGGGGNLKMGVIRPDAELVRSWTYDRWYVSDLGNTIPAYQTSSKTLVSASTLSPTISCDFAAYRYFVLIRALAYFSYNTSTPAKGRAEYTMLDNLYEVYNIPANTIEATDGTKMTTAWTGVSAVGAVTQTIYWSSATALNRSSSSYWGYPKVNTSPSITNGTLKVTSPYFAMCGSGTYFPQAVWNTVTDMRMQYFVGVYRAQNNSLGLTGWGYESQLSHLIDCAQSANRTLT